MEQAWYLGQGRGSGAEEIEMRSIIVGLLAFLASFAALHITYPWATYYGNFEFGWWRTMTAYVITAAFLGVVAGVSSVRLQRASTRSIALRAFSCGVINFVSALLLALLLGPVGMTLPGTRVRGIFFAEWSFLNFLGFVALPIAIFVGFLCSWNLRRQSQHTGA